MVLRQETPRGAVGVNRLWAGNERKETAMANKEVDLGDGAPAATQSTDGWDPTRRRPAFNAISAGPIDPFKHAVSFILNWPTQNQNELDRNWDVLLAAGGMPEQCGWLQGRYGMQWQIGPLFFLATYMMAYAGSPTLR